MVFDLIRRIENHEEYKIKFNPEKPEIKKCIYCLSGTGTFNSEEHVLPETLAGDDIYLPKGVVCDECNHGISSKLDEVLINFEPIAFLRVLFTPYTKSGKFPKANFQNLLIEKTDPNHIKITAKDKTGRRKNVRTLEDGQEAFNMSLRGKRLDWQLYARAIYKFALGFVAYDIGHKAALNEKYQPARDFIFGKSSFDNSMMVSTKSIPHPYISTEIITYCDNLQLERTLFYIDIFGMIFMVNLEETPRSPDASKANEMLDGISKEHKFEIVSLR